MQVMVQLLVVFLSVLEVAAVLVQLEQQAQVLVQQDLKVLLAQLVQPDLRVLQVLEPQVLRASKVLQAVRVLQAQQVLLESKVFRVPLA
jgi:hypothetical protein